MAYSTTNIRGLNTVLANLNKAIQKIEGVTQKGLIEAVVIIREDMNATPPKVPRDWGNLDSSFFSVTPKSVEEGRSANFKGPNASAIGANHKTTLEEAKGMIHQGSIKGPAIIFGFSANYAAAVHEMLESPSGKPINWNRPGSGPKFLEYALKRNTKRILQVIKENAQI